MPSENELPSEEGALLLEYLPKLMRLAERNMSNQLRQKCGADDMADSILGSIIRMNRQQKLPLAIEQSEDFWRYLVVVSLQKIRKKARHYGTQKRSVANEVPLQDLDNLLRDAGEPTQQGADDVVEVLENARRQLDEESQEILAGKLAGLTNAQIAEGLAGGEGRSTKTVTRRWKIVEEAIRTAILDREETE